MNHRDKSPPTRLYLWSGQALVFGIPANTQFHSHHALQISIGLDADFRVRTDSEKVWREHRAALICADEPHQFEDPQASTVNLYLDPESSAARRICLRQSPSGCCPLAVDAIEPLLAELQSIEQNSFSCAAASGWMQNLFGILTDAQPTPPKIDARIKRSLKLLEETPNNSIALTEMANAVRLSPGRFAHLFRAQTNLPVRRYLLWMRLRAAIRLLSSSISLTEAAHTAGFADSAHLTRTFRRMFGIAPSEIFQNSQFVQVNFCDD